MFDGLYRGKRVLVTGHTGFKGSWLAFWLVHLGAEVHGYALDIPTTPSNFEALALRERIHHHQGDIRDAARLGAVFESCRPQIVFHLAAQSLVRRSYAAPRETFEVNAMGTLQVLECIRSRGGVEAAVIITSDKCYRNLEWPFGYRETDRLGGEDPYSASKGCAELVVYAYHHSFLGSTSRIASTRAGNVIGGGDWAEDRIVPDAMRAWSAGRPLKVRSPRATRPWQHVLEPLSGYLWLGARLCRTDGGIGGEAFNFGPDAKTTATVGELLERMAAGWPGARWSVEEPSAARVKEATLLKLCCDKALQALRWHAALSLEETIDLTVDWYRSFYAGTVDMADLTLRQIRRYGRQAAALGLPWAGSGGDATP